MGARAATTPTLGALAVLPHQGRALLVRRRNEPDAGLWGFPGGHVELGETVLDAATRELREETGVVAEALEAFGNLDFISRDPAGAVTYHFHLVGVLCRYVSGTPRAADDVSDARWVPTDDILARALPMSRDVDTALRAALAQTEP